MKIVLQRVNGARVETDGETVGEIGKGYVVFLGVTEGDTAAVAEKLADKIARLRIFADGAGKTNLSARDVGGEILIVSQFTLAADLSSNRPSFSQAAKPERARELYEYFTELCSKRFAKTATGRFASHMHVFCDNDGPFTLVLEG